MKKIAYLINQYPMASLTFIRREIAAIEATGVPVQRYAVRGWDTPLVDPDDVAEASRTQRILDVGGVRLVLALAGTALGRPRRFARALAEAWRVARNSERGVAFGLIYLAEACVLRKWTRRDHIAHLHVHFGTNSTAVAMLCRLLDGPPYSFTVHGPEEFDSPVSLRLGRKIRHAAFVISICSYGRSQLWRWAEFRDWGKVHLVHCGLDRGFLEASPSTPSSAPRLINIGRLSEQKGQHILVEAAARLRAQGRDFEIVLIGGGPLRDSIEERVRQLDLGKHVKLAGWMTGPQVREELLASRGLVLPSFAEGLPVVIMESLALGRPVIATYVAGIPELVRTGETGWLVPAGDVEELVAAMGQMLDAPVEQLERMGQAGATRVARDHDVRTEARKLLDLIERTAPDEP
ncbi:MAG TPA: glycosyltransferase [Planctomycetaceae bacterium]|nr:glycosyltransferase [Planctomycetaceae bacterium]